MPDLMQFACNMLANNPRVANNPQMRNYISAIQSGDSVKGQQMANEICRNNGITPEEGISKARGFFHI